MMEPKIIIKNYEEEIESFRSTIYRAFVLRELHDYFVFSGSFVEENTNTELFKIDLKLVKKSPPTIKFVLTFESWLKPYDFAEFFAQLLFDKRIIPGCLRSLVRNTAILKAPTILKLGGRTKDILITYEIKDNKVQKQIDAKWARYVAIEMHRELIEWMEEVNKGINNCPEAGNRYISIVNLQRMIEQLNLQIKSKLVSILIELEDYFVSVVNNALAQGHYGQ